MTGRELSGGRIRGREYGAEEADVSELVETIARIESTLRAQVAELLDERKLGPVQNVCANPACSTSRYGEGYKACPGCGSKSGKVLR